MNWINISATLAIAMALLIFVQGVFILRHVRKEEFKDAPQEKAKQEVKEVKGTAKGKVSEGGNNQIKEKGKKEITPILAWLIILFAVARMIIQVVLPSSGRSAAEGGGMEGEKTTVSVAAVKKGKKGEKNTEPVTAQRKVTEGGVETHKIIGWMTILLATLGVLINLLFLSSDIAISREFDAIIIQGAWPRFFFFLCLFGLILTVSMGWNLARLRAGWKSLWWLYLLAILFGLASTSLLYRSINTPVLSEATIPVFMYDIWWPPLLLWLIIGFTDIALTILKVDDLTIRRLASSAMAILGIVFASFMKSSPDFVNPLTGYLWMAIGFLSLIVISLDLFQPSRMWKKKVEEQTNNSLQLHLSKYKVNKINKEQRMTLMWLLIIVIGVGVLIFSPSLIGPAPGIIILLVGWGGMTELIADGLFHDLYVNRGRWYESINKKSDTAGTWIETQGGKLGKVFSIPPGLAAFVKLFFIVVLLIILNETLNYGKTIIQPFQVIGFEDTNALVNSVDDRLINDLSLLNQQFQPILVFPTSTGVQKKRIDYVQAGNISTTIDAALANSGQFQVGAVTVPANVLVAPVQGLVRPWLKVRVVQGSIILDQDHYVLLVNASDGSTWISQPTDVQELDQAIPKMANEIAFLMLSSEDTLQNYGLTNNWDAFLSFQKGVKYIQMYENKHNYDYLASAIVNFGDATIKDQNFALAYYRLGLALQQYRQPLQAENALRKGLSLNPDSVPLRNALAYHLYFYDSYTPLYPAVISPPRNIKSEDVKDKKKQALRLWHQIVNFRDSQVLPADRASAYLGLCNAAMESRKSYLAYFYCFKSHTLLERLPHDQQSQDKIRQADASALNNLGKIVINMASTRTKTIKGWVCLGRNLMREKNDFYYHPAYARAALWYYEKALALQPENSVIQCNAAIAAKLLGQGKRMDELELSAQAHYVLGVKYLDQARKDLKNSNYPSPYFKEAFKEYQRAIDLNPSYHEALNAYAYAYWIFRMHWPMRKLYTLGLPHLDVLAEYYAEKALRLPKMEQNDYLDVIYSRTKAEVFIANGEFQKARDILVKLEKPPEDKLGEQEDNPVDNSTEEEDNKKVPDSYMFDDFRWDLAQVSYCLAQQTRDGPTKASLEADAINHLNTIWSNEEKLETYVFRYNDNSNQLLTNYRLPCGELNPFRQVRRYR